MARLRHTRACPGHPRPEGPSSQEIVMAGSSPAMTISWMPPLQGGPVPHLYPSAKTHPSNKDSKDKPMNILPGNMPFGAGQPVKRLEDQRLLTGKGQFIDDRPEDGALWLHVLRSPHAHAKIVSLDTKAAADMPDVKAVYTGADLIADYIGTIPTLSVFQQPDGSPMTVPPRRLLAHEIVRFAGEPVAAGVGTSRLAAQAAAEAITGDYEVLP